MGLRVVDIILVYSAKVTSFFFFSFGIALEKTIFISSDLWIKSLKADCLLGEILFPLWVVYGGRMCTAKSVSFFPCETQSLDVV